MKKQFLVLPFLFFYCLAFSQTEIELKAPCINSPDTIQGQDVILAPDSYAEYPGGQMEMNKFIIQNIDYSVQPDFGGMIWVTFVVDTNGIVSNKCIFNRPKDNEYMAIENEIIRVLDLLPKWEPAKKSNKPVPSRIQFPLSLMPQTKK